MRIYLAHAKANYASRGDGYVMAMREVEHALTLYSFHYLEDQGALPIHEDISSLQHGEVVDEYRIRP